MTARTPASTTPFDGHAALCAHFPRTLPVSFSGEPFCRCHSEFSRVGCILLNLRVVVGLRLHQLLLRVSTHFFPGLQACQHVRHVGFRSHVARLKVSHTQTAVLLV